MSFRDSFVDVGFRTLNNVHKAVLRVSRGRVGSSAFGLQVIELVTTGRKSGVLRNTILTAPLYEKDRVVLVASKGGDDRNPLWFRNLVSEPKVTIRANGEAREMRTRVATHEEGASLWPQVIAAYGPYERYRRKSHREIPLVSCEPN